MNTTKLRRRSRLERRVTFALKILALVVLAAMILSAFIGFAGRVSAVTIILVGAVFFTYAVYPIVRYLNRRLPLVLAVTVVYAGIALLAVFGISVVMPAFVQDSQALIKAYPSFVHSAQSFFTDPNNRLVARLPQGVRDYLAGLPLQIAHLAQAYAGQAAARALTLVLSAFALIATVIVIPVLSMYLIFEAENLRRSFIETIPPKSRKKAILVLNDLDKVLGGFIRGQFIVGATIGTCITIALLLTHVKYAVLIGVTAGLLDVIPYVGAVVGFIPAVSLALLNDGWQHALLVAALFAGIFQLEGHFIAPRIVSDSVGLSPLMVIIAILIGGDLLGIGGMFLAVPIAAMLRVIILHSIPKYEAPPEAKLLAERAPEHPGVETALSQGA